MKDKIIMAITSMFLFCGAAFAEMYWTKPKEAMSLAGYVDQYSVAINKEGQGLLSFDYKFFVNFDLTTNQWQFSHIKMEGDSVGLETFNEVYRSLSSSESSFARQTVVINDLSKGFALFRVPEGVHQGKVGCFAYQKGQWEGSKVLSKEKGLCPVIVQSSFGKAVVVWINERTKRLESAFFNGEKWSEAQEISSRVFVDLDYNQAPPQVVINEIGDAVVVWKSSKADQQAEILATFFDGIEEKWLLDEKLGDQSLLKKGMSVSMNSRGDVMAVWENEKGIQSAHVNVSERIICLSSEKDGFKVDYLHHAQWKKALVEEGNDLTGPKVVIGEDGEALVLWLQGFDGVRASHFSSSTRSFEAPYTLVSRPVYSLALKKNLSSSVYSTWVQEGESLSEEICYQIYDLKQKAWGKVGILAKNDNSLVDTVEVFSLASADKGILLWYDFFKEKLFFSIVKKEKEASDLNVVVKPQKREDLKKIRDAKGARSKLKSVRLGKGLR